MSDQDSYIEPTPDETDSGVEEATTRVEEATTRVEEPAQPAAPAVPEQEEARVEVHRVFVGTGLFWGLVLAAVLTVIVIILAVQNIQQVTVKFLTFEGGAPLIAVLLASLLVGVILDEIVGWAYRARRRRILTEKEELKRLRAAQESAEE